MTEQVQVQLNHEVLWKRLLALMDMSGYLISRDGHIWIECEMGEYSDTHSLSDILKECGVILNSKIYGGILEALDTIDLALHSCGKPSLLESYNPDIQFLGSKFGADVSRVDIVGKGRGGIS